MQIYREVAAQLRPERQDKPKAVEFKFENISAVLEQEQVRWVSGLKPKRNYQHALERAVVGRLDGRNESVNTWSATGRAGLTMASSRSQRNSRSRLRVSRASRRPETQARGSASLGFGRPR